MFYAKDLLQNVARFTEKHECRSLFLIKLSLQLYLKRLTQAFSCEFFEIIKAEVESEGSYFE